MGTHTMQTFVLLFLTGFEALIFFPGGYESSSVSSRGSSRSLLEVISNPSSKYSNNLTTFLFFTHKGPRGERIILGVFCWCAQLP